MSGAGGEITAEARELSHRDPGGTTETGKSIVEHFLGRNYHFCEHTVSNMTKLLGMG